MKKFFKIIGISSLLVFTILSCKKDEHRIYLEAGTAPVLSSSVQDNIPLSNANKDNEAIKLSWTNPEYEFTTGVSSQDVFYQVEIDTAGSGFTSPKRQTVSVNKDLSISFTQGQLNDYLLNQLQLTPENVHNIEIRVTSFLTNSAVPLISNVLKFTATPYTIPPKVNPPSTGHLYLVGDATDGGWNNPVPVPTQEFTKIDDLHFEITVFLTGGKQYLFLPLNGDWGHKYACKKTADQSPDGGDFGFDFSDNFPGPLISDSYKITVDFQRGKYTVE
jgi:hypothetical protein